MNEPLWWITKDGDERAAKFFDRHYSRQFYRDERKPKLFCGPGQKIVLRTYDCDALFIWRKFKDNCIDARTGLPQQGINCAVFRNEASALSSELIRQADAIADFCWSDNRHYTYVDARRIRSANPGFCFIQAGWKRCGFTKGGLLILERIHDENTSVGRASSQGALPVSEDSLSHPNVAGAEKAKDSGGKEP